MCRNKVFHPAAVRLLGLILLTAAIISAMLFLSVAPGSAASPANDDFNNRTVIAGLPFSDSLVTTEATTAPSDPFPCGYYTVNTVWYEYTPAETTVVQIDSFGSSYASLVGVYQGGEGMFYEIACSGSNNTYPLVVTLEAGWDYSIMVGAYPASYPGPYPGPATGGNLSFHIAQLATPDNDDFDNAKVIADIPYVDTMDTSYATSAPDDPTECWNNNGSVWYAFTPPVDMILEANTSGSYYDTTLSAYTGTRGALSMVPGACNDDSEYGLQSKVEFSATAGVTYYFLVGRCCGVGGNGGGYLVFNLLQHLPPENDNFENAIQIGQVPFSYTGNNQYATLQPQEPKASCSSWDDQNRTVWFKYTPDQSGSVTLRSSGFYYQFKAVYEGTSLNHLTELGCKFGNYDNTMRINLVAGKTYYIQFGGAYSWDYGWYQLQMEWTPPPQVSFFWIPAEPNLYNTVHFISNSYDPAGGWIVDYTWDFGDGSIDHYGMAYHKYARDGDYTVRLTIQTDDGRTATKTDVIHVRTHDVAITKFITPNAASPGQTRRITVGVRNYQYPETALVMLYKTGPYGFYPIGSQVQEVPVHKGNRTTDFVFNYTFTEDDAYYGKVGFVATAQIESTDAMGADNNAFGKPTKINGAVKPTPYYSTIIETPGKLGLAATSGLLSMSLLAGFLLVVGLPGRRPRR